METLNFDTFLAAVENLRDTPTTPEEIIRARTFFARLQTVHSLPSRYYHGVPHIAFMSTSLMNKELVDALHTSSFPRPPSTTERALLQMHLGSVEYLAGFYHDYLQVLVDGGIPDALEHLLGRFEGNVYTLRKPESLSPTLYDATRAVFNFQDHQQFDIHKLPGSGLDEYLSAIMAAVELGGNGLHLPEKHILQIVAAITATVPFKPQAQFQNIHGRLRQASAILAGSTPESGLSAQEIQQTMLIATDVANRDVINFAAHALAKFLHNTMLLIPEVYAPARSHPTAEEFRQSMVGSLGFFRFLLTGENYKNVFHHYRGYPSSQTYEALCGKAKENLEYGTDFLQCKYVSASIVKALATMAHQEHTPIAQLLSPLRRFESAGQPVTPVMKVLSGEGRADIPGFDIKESPIAFLIACSAGMDALKKLYTSIDPLSSDIKIDLHTAENATHFLETVKTEIGQQRLAEILGGMIKVARYHDTKDSRNRPLSEALLGIAQTLGISTLAVMRYAGSTVSMGK
jgi:hypothetical protein